MNRLRVVVADDEPLARTRVCRLLSGDPGIEIVARCESADEVLQAVAGGNIDAIFLDIEMPEGDGFSALAALPPPRPGIVFVTAYSEYAVQAFDVDAVDYLVKPVSQARLMAAVARLRARRTAEDGTTTPVFPERLPLPTGRRIRLVEVERIDRILAQANYLEIFSEGRSYVLRRPMAWIETQLDPARFVRIHRSHIVRISAVRTVEPQASGRYRLTLADGLQLHSGRSHRARVREAFGLGDTMD